MKNSDFAALLIGKRIVAVELRSESETPAGEVHIQAMKFSDGSVLELRGENGYASYTVAALTKVAA